MALTRTIAGSATLPFGTAAATDFTTGSFSVVTGDVVVVCVELDESSGLVGVDLPTATGTALPAFSLAITVNDVPSPLATIATSVATGSGSVTVSAGSLTAGSDDTRSVLVMVVSGGALGGSTHVISASGSASAPSVALTPRHASSLVVGVISADASGGARTYLNGGVEDFAEPGRAFFFHTTSPSLASYSIGLSAPTIPDWAIAAVEITDATVSLGDPGYGHIVLEDGSGNYEMEGTTDDYRLDTNLVAASEAAGTASLGLSAAGVHSSVGSASIALSGSGPAGVTAVGTASLSLSAAGAPGAVLVATASLSLSATGAATPGATAASGSASLSLSGAGVHSSVGSASIAMTGAGAARAPTSGTASLAMSGAGVQSSVGTASLSLSGSGVARGAGTASASLSLSGSGTAGYATSGSASLSLSATGAPASTAVGSAALALSGVGAAGVGRDGTASLSLSGTGAVSAPVSASASLSLSAVGEAHGPLAPTGLTVTPISSVELLIDWDDYVDALAYEIERDGSFLVRTTASTYSDTGLDPATQYCYRVRALI